MLLMLLLLELQLWGLLVAAFECVAVAAVVDVAVVEVTATEN